jgi:hypothetical protein
MSLSLKVRKIYANVAAFRGRTKFERRQIRRRIMGATREDDSVDTHHTNIEVNKLIQQHTFPAEVKSAKRLLVLLVPEHNAMSGGIFSIFSITDQLRRLKRFHGYEVVLMTRPNGEGETYFRNTNFRNPENVYRFSQLLQCTDVEELYLQIPEYATAHFCDDLSRQELAYLSGRTVFVNILNQNIQLMPEAAQLSPLKNLAKEVTQSVAHHAYFSQDMANKYGIPTLLLPAYTDLSSYPGCGFADKEKLIIYSLDKAEHKERCLAKIAAELPDYKLIEIKDITFDRFMDLATRCMFSITFGEGFDGYLAQPTLQGGVGFAVYNDDFFPSPHFKDYENIFGSGEEMVNRICDVMRKLAGNQAAYTDLNKRFAAEYDSLYSFGDYVERVKKLSLREFELFPSGG